MSAAVRDDEQEPHATAALQTKHPEVVQSTLRTYTNRLSSNRPNGDLQTYASITFSSTFDKAENHTLFFSSQPPMSESVEWVSSFVGDAPPGEVRLMPFPSPY